jgi:hypothetical protein
MTHLIEYPYLSDKMTDGINLLEESSAPFSHPRASFMPLLAITICICLMPVVILLVHRVANDRLMRQMSHPSVWPFLVVYDLLREHFMQRPLPLRRELVIGHLPMIPEYDDPPVFTSWKRPDPPLDGAEDPIT